MEYTRRLQRDDASDERRIRADGRCPPLQIVYRSINVKRITMKHGSIEISKEETRIVIRIEFPVDALVSTPIMI
jgi:hypothetical protein